MLDQDVSVTGAGDMLMLYTEIMWINEKEWISNINIDVNWKVVYFKACHDPISHVVLPEGGNLLILQLICYYTANVA